MICDQCLYSLNIAYLFRTLCEATHVKLLKEFKKEGMDKKEDTSTNTSFESTNDKLESENYYFSSSPNELNEIVLDPQGNKYEESDNLEIPMDNNPAENVKKKETPATQIANDKVGRHILKKNTGKCPQRFPPVRVENIEPHIETNNTKKELNNVKVTVHKNVMPSEHQITMHNIDNTQIEQNDTQSVKINKKISKKKNETLKNCRISKKKLKNLTCEICSKSFPYRSHLVRHLNVHYGEKIYTCTYCKKRFINSYNLSVHLQKHTGEFPLKCKICEQGFSSPSVLKRHLNSHTGTRKHQCKFCDKKFLHMSSLKVHEMMHVQRPAFTCDICFKIFSYSNSLTQHKKTHTGQKDYSCYICAREFTRNTSLRRHMISNHSMEDESAKISCKYCNTSFNNRRSFKNHLIAHPKHCRAANLHR